jgi:DNA-binding NtrC family response regulator
MKTARILVIDDDDHVRDALVDELGLHYVVEAVGSSTEAFDALATHQYDVVISDLKMPDHDGIEVLEFARDHQRDAVRVLLTGYLDERAHRALLSPDAPYKVGKPWHDEIEVVVRRGLEQREAARRLSASVEDALSMSTFDE